MKKLTRLRLFEIRPAHNDREKFLFNLRICLMLLTQQYIKLKNDGSLTVRVVL